VPGGAGVQQDQEQPGADDQVDRLLAGGRGHREHGGADRPGPFVLLIGQQHQFVGGDRDDRHYGRGDAVEQRGHDAQAGVVGVERGHGDDHEEGRGDERQSGRGRAQYPAAQVTHPHGDLRGQGAGHGLAERNPVEEVLLGDPAARLHQVALHIADHRDRPAEPERAQA